jgi:para-nitrobenzyl esterase
LEAGAPRKVPIIVGSNADEATFFLNPATFPESLESYESLIESRYREAAAEFSATYPILREEDIPATLLAAHRDSKWSLTARTWARLMSQDGGNAYLYFFRKVPPNATGRDYGAHHGSELAYALGNTHRVLESNPDETDRMISEAMADYWVSFAATGYPEGPGLPEWEAYDLIGEPHLEFGDSIRSGNHLFKEQLDFWERFLRRLP